MWETKNQLLGNLDWRSRCRSVLQILTLFQTKKCHFLHSFSDRASKIQTRFQTWPPRNYIIITQLQEHQKKRFTKNLFRICILLFLSYSFGIETISTYMPSLSSLENHTRSIPVFRPNRRKHPTLRGDTFLYDSYMAYIRGDPRHKYRSFFFLVCSSYTTYTHRELIYYRPGLCLVNLRCVKVEILPTRVVYSCNSKQNLGRYFYHLYTGAYN